jgi:hypothetical protein
VGDGHAGFLPAAQQGEDIEPAMGWFPWDVLVPEAGAGLLFIAYLFFSRTLGHAPS